MKKLVLSLALVFSLGTNSFAVDCKDPQSFMQSASNDVIKVLESGRYPLQETITHCVSFDQAGEALAAWAKDPGSVTKIHVEL